MSVSFTTYFAQTTFPPPPPEVIRREPIGKSRGDTGSIFIKRGSLSFKRRLSGKDKKRIAPDASELNRYAAFLRNPKTGLIKLFPDIGCEDNANVIRADEDCLKWVQMSGFYSFREKQHTRDFLSDIRLKDGVLITDGLLSQGIIVALGDVALENITLSSDGLKFLNEFKPEPQSGEALKQTVEIIKGIKSGDYVYKKALTAKENTTYALRVVAYRGSFIQTFRGQQFDMLGGDKRIDITMAFRLVKKDEPGTVTLLWKELSRKTAPKVIVPKRNKKAR